MKKKNELALSNKEIKKLSKLGKNIQRSLSCDINGMGIPCRTDRFAAADLMVKYLKIHFEPGVLTKHFKSKKS